MESDSLLLVSQNIRRVRERQGLSLWDLSERTGIAQSFLITLEKGERDPTLEVLWNIAKALEVSFGHLMEGSPKTNSNTFNMKLFLAGGGEIRLIDRYCDDHEVETYEMTLEAGHYYRSSSHSMGVIADLTLLQGKLIVEDVKKCICLGKDQSHSFSADSAHSYFALNEKAVFKVILHYPRQTDALDEGFIDHVLPGSRGLNDKVSPTAKCTCSGRFDFSSVLTGLVSSLPVAIGYVPVAISFGLVAVHSGLNPWIVVFASTVMFAGASQFMLVSLLTSGAGFLMSLVTVLMMNARHIFYGPPLWRKFSAGATKGFPSIGLAFGLTDEVFATALTRLENLPEHQQASWYLGLQLGAYIAWVGGTFLGVVMGAFFNQMPDFLKSAMEFVLPALFVALLCEFVSRKTLPIVLVAAVTTFMALQLAIPSYLAILIGMFSGALSAIWQRTSDG